MNRKDIQTLSRASEDFLMAAQKYEMTFGGFLSEINEKQLLSEERNKVAVYTEVLRHAVAIGNLIEKTKLDILIEGKLVQQINGHYAVQGVEIRKGTYVEFWVPESNNNHVGYFHPSVIEYDEKGYYLLDSKGNRQSLDGRLVRLK